MLTELKARDVHLKIPLTTDNFQWLYSNFSTILFQRNSVKLVYESGEDKSGCITGRLISEDTLYIKLNSHQEGRFRNSVTGGLTCLLKNFGGYGKLKVTNENNKVREWKYYKGKIIKKGIR